jgi:hypothetical protein
MSSQLCGRWCATDLLESAEADVEDAPDRAARVESLT